jgi:hypothetical protein
MDARVRFDILVTSPMVVRSLFAASDGLLMVRTGSESLRCEAVRSVAPRRAALLWKGGMVAPGSTKANVRLGGRGSRLGSRSERGIVARFGRRRTDCVQVRPHARTLITLSGRLIDDGLMVIDPSILRLHLRANDVEARMI